MNKAIQIILITAVCFFWSCSEDPLTTNKPYISSISSSQIIAGDTITLSGNDFTFQNSSARIIFSSGKSLIFSDCLKWNNNYIKFIMPENIVSGILAVVVNSDTSNKLNITVSNYPIPEMVELKSDSFSMGNSLALLSEKPVHKVILTKNYLISKTEITQRLWKAITGKNPSIFKGGDLPVNNVNWNEAIDFCNKLSLAEGLKPYYKISGDTVRIDTTSKGYRLPTEAEWEYACKYKSNRDFSGSGNINEMGWYALNSAYAPHSVGSKQANELGLFDMHGNVWEWCWDFYSENYYQSTPTKDPAGPANGTQHVLRGGSFIDGASFCRSTGRSFPYTTFENCGLRIAKNI